MLETAVAQLRFAASLLLGRSFSPWALEHLVKSLRETMAEFGPLAAGGSEVMRGPAMDEATRREMQRRRLRNQAMRAQGTPYYAALFAQIGLDPTQIKQDAD